MTEQTHHKTTPEASRASDELSSQPTERPLTGLYILRTGRDGSPDYMDGGWSVLGRQTVGGTEYTRVMKPAGIYDEQGKEKIYARDIPTDTLYEQHRAESERVLSEQQAALGKGAVEVVSLEQNLAPALEESEQTTRDEPAAPEREEKRELSEDAREDLKKKWSELFGSADTSEQMLENYIKGLQGRGAPVSPADMLRELQNWVPSQSFSELRTDVMKTYSDNGDDAWLGTVARKLTSLGNIYPGLAYELPHQHSADNVMGYLQSAKAQVQRLKHEVREALRPTVQAQEPRHEL